MHEFSVCRNLLNQVAHVAAQHGATSVQRVRVRIGPLSGVDPALLAQAFPLARQQTIAAEAELVIDRQPIRLHCRRCGKDSAATPNKLICGVCGDGQTQLISGDELMLTDIMLGPSPGQEP